MSERILYLGLEVPQEMEGEIVHCPLIQIEPLDLAPCLEKWREATHVIFTSKTAARILKPHVSFLNKQCIAVGTKTAAELPAALIAERETAEGVVKLLEGLDLSEAVVLWPHSALSRPVIEPYLQNHDIKHYTFPIYTTMARCPDPIPDLSEFDAISFTSPSTVDAFEKIWSKAPSHLDLRAIGPVTEKRLHSLRNRST